MLVGVSLAQPLQYGLLCTKSRIGMLMINNKSYFIFRVFTVLSICSSFFLKQVPCLGQDNGAQGKVLRIQPIINFNFKTTAYEFEKNMMPLLEKYNIAFVNRNPDITLICGSLTKDMLKLSKPRILLDDSESASISHLTRKSLKNPYTIAVFKNTALRPRSLYNQMLKYHFNLISFNKKNINMDTLSQHELQKIRAVLWDTYRSPFNNSLDGNNLIPLKELTIDFDAEKPVERPIDVFFSGSVSDKNPPGVHREKLMRTLESIQLSHPKRTIVSHKGRLLKNEYLDLLRTSKIAVSPWGNAEWCWRDYEAIYSGTIVIKPDTDFVQAVPDLYRSNKYYIACKPDFSDLEEKIFYVLENYEKLTDMRKDARNLLVDHWNDEKIAYDLAQALREAFEKYSDTSPSAGHLNKK